MVNKSAIKIKTIAFLKSLFGKRVIYQLLERKYIEIYKRNKILFIHIPKAAGTSIANVLYGKRNGHLKASFVKIKMGELLYSEKYSFTVTRNPYDRLISAYRFARQGRTKDGAIADPEFYQAPIFETFEGFIKKWLTHQDLNLLDPVFQPQYSFVFDDNEQLLVDGLFKMESMEELEKVLSERLKKEVKIGKKNKSQIKIETVYTPQLEEIVYGLYKKDFILLGYDK